MQWWNCASILTGVMLYCIDMCVNPDTKYHSLQDHTYTLLDTTFINHAKSYQFFFVLLKWEVDRYH